MRSISTWTAVRVTARRRAAFVVGVFGVIGVAAAVTACTPAPAPAPPTGTVGSLPAATGSTSGPATSASTPTSSPTTAQPTPSVLPVPAAASANTVEGAQEFVTYVVALINQAYRTADPAILDTVFAPECPACKGIRDGAGQLAAQGQRAATDMWTTHYVVAHSWSPGSAEVEASIAQARTGLLDGQGRPVSDLPAVGPLKFYLTLTRGTSWRVVRWQEIAQ